MSNDTAIYTIYQFYAELIDYEPKKWQRFQVKSNVTMAKLGYILMTVFERQASDLFSFEIPFDENFCICVGKYLSNDNNQKVLAMIEENIIPKRIHIKFFDEPFDNFVNIKATNKKEIRVKNIDAREIRVKHVVAQKNERMTFVHEDVDNWKLEIVLEKIYKGYRTIKKRAAKEIINGEVYAIIPKNVNICELFCR